MLSDEELLLTVVSRKKSGWPAAGTTLKRALFLAALVAGTAGAQTAGTYTKKGGIVEVGKTSGQAVPFTIQSSVGQNTCTLEGTARLVDAARAAYTSDDPKDMCVAVLNFAGGGLKVTTKACASACGVGAEGSMDGAYTRKR